MKLSEDTRYRLELAVKSIRSYPCVNGVTLVSKEWMDTVVEMIEHILEKDVGG